MFLYIMKILISVNNKIKLPVTPRHWQWVVPRSDQGILWKVDPTYQTGDVGSDVSDDSDYFSGNVDSLPKYYEVFFSEKVLWDEPRTLTKRWRPVVSVETMGCNSYWGQTGDEKHRFPPDYHDLTNTNSSRIDHRRGSRDRTVVLERQDRQDPLWLWKRGLKGLKGPQTDHGSPLPLFTSSFTTG